MIFDNGGPAFPRTASPGGYDTHEVGMSLRDYFAAKAMQAIYSRFGGGAAASNGDGTLDYAARMAYEMAEAMIKARQ